MKNVKMKVMSFVLLLAMVFTTAVSAVPVFAEEENYSIEIDCIMLDTGKTATMFAMDSVFASKQSDGTYLVSMHETKENRNILCLSANTDACTAHKYDWYVADENYRFVVPVASLDDPLTFCMSSDERVAQGSAFSNAVVVTFKKDTMVPSETSVSAEALNVLPKVVNTHSISVSSIMRDTGKPSGMYTFDNAYVTKLSDGTYLASIHQTSNNRNVIAITDDKNAANAHEVDWYFGNDEFVVVFPVENLSEPVFFCMSNPARIEQGQEFSNIIVLTFDEETMAETENANLTLDDLNVSEAVILADYSAVDAALETVPEDLSLYTDESVAALNTAIAAVDRTLTSDRQDEVDAMAKAVADAVSALAEKPEEEEPVELTNGTYTTTVTTSSSMFKVVGCRFTVKDGKVTAKLALSGTGYDMLYLGTAEDAASDSENWISYSLNEDEKYEFELPISALDKEIEVASHAVKSGSWSDRTVTLSLADCKVYIPAVGIYRTTATTDSKMFKVTDVLFATDGEEMSALIVLSGTGYTKMYFGSAEAAATAEEVQDAVVNEEGKYAFELPVECLDREIKIAVYSESSSKWYDRQVVIESANLEYLMAPPADYSAVLDAIDSIPEDLSVYTEESLNALLSALEAVEENLTIEDQDKVDAMAKAIEDAIAGLELAVVDVIPEDGTYTTTVTTSSSMFKVVGAVLTSKEKHVVATITLSGSGYTKLYVGTGEEAALDEENVIEAVVTEDGLYTFTIPVESLDRDIAVAAFSAKSEKWFDRTVNFSSENLAPFIPAEGDYTVEATTNSPMFKVTEAILSSNGESMTVLVTLSGSGYTKLYVGTGEEAAADEENVIEAVVTEDGKYTFEFPLEILDRDIAVAAFSAKSEKWFDRTVSFDCSSLTLIKDEETEGGEEGENPGETPDDNNQGEKPNGPATDEEINNIINNTQKGDVGDGTYTPSFAFTGGTGKTVISCKNVVVKNGKATGTIVFSSKSITWVEVDGVKYYNENNGGESTFTIPVKINSQMTISAETVAMSTPHVIEYTLYTYINGQNAADQVVAVTPVAPDEKVEDDKNTAENSQDNQQPGNAVDSVGNTSVDDLDGTVTTQGQKKSVLPWIILLILLICAIAYMYFKKILLFAFLKK